jgi:hypothetical protein
MTIHLPIAIGQNRAFEMILVDVMRSTEDLSGTGATRARIVDRWSVWYWQTKVDSLPDDRLVAQFKYEYFYAECFIGGEKYVFRCRDGNDLFDSVPLVESDLQDRIDKARPLAIDLEDLAF